MLMQRVHVCAAIILCITHACLSSENQTVNNNVTKSESNDLKSIFNLAGNFTESLDTAKPDEDHTQAQRNTSEDGEEMNKETHGANPAIDGDYLRLLNPGEYKIMVWAEGYFPSIRHCSVGSEPHTTICDFALTKTSQDHLKQILASGGKIPRENQVRIRAMRMRKLHASNKILNRRREQQQHLKVKQK